MSNSRFVVWMGAREGELGPKIFERGEDAIAYASQRVADDARTADIYEVVLPDMPEERMNRAAIAALEMGEGHLIYAFLTQGGVAAIYGPGTNIPAAAGEILHLIEKKRLAA